MSGCVKKYIHLSYLTKSLNSLNHVYGAITSYNLDSLNDVYSDYLYDSGTQH